MKKLILPIVFFLLFLLFPLNISAQSAIDEYQLAKDKCVGKKYNECNKKYNSESCGSNVGAEYVRWAACQENLTDMIEKCQEEIDSEYPPCKEVKKESLKRQEQNLSQPSESIPEPTSVEQTPPTSSKDDKTEPNDRDGFIFVKPDLGSVSDFITITYLDSDIKGGPPPDRQPTITTEDGEKIWDIPSETQGYSDFNVWQIGGNQMRPVKIKPSLSLTSPTSITIIPEGEPMRYRYDWNKRSGAVFDVFPKSNVTLQKPTQDKETQEIKRMIKLNKGELEIKVKNVNAKNKFGVQTDFVELIVIGTHFWVKNDPDKRQTSVAVYAGKVEVKTKDGKTTLVSPDGDRPRVVVITQKLSIVKLAIGSLMLAAIIGTVVLIMKRRFRPKAPIKRKK